MRNYYYGDKPTYNPTENENNGHEMPHFAPTLAPKPRRETSARPQPNATPVDKSNPTLAFKGPTWPPALTSEAFANAETPSIHPAEAVALAVAKLACTEAIPLAVPALTLATPAEADAILLVFVITTPA